jgi:hypothetical protein
MVKRFTLPPDIRRALASGSRLLNVVKAVRESGVTLSGAIRWEGLRAAQLLPKTLGKAKVTIKPLLPQIENATAGTFTLLSITATTAHQWLLKIGKETTGLVNSAARLPRGGRNEHPQEQYAALCKVCLAVPQAQAGDWSKAEAQLRREARDVAIARRNAARKRSWKRRRQIAPDQDTIIATMPNAVRLAWMAYETAVDKKGNNLTSSEAHTWLNEQVDDFYKPPSVETFARYVTKARGLLGEQKNHPRAGRTGRSVVRTDQR